jgi:hypothetical protein
VKRIEVHEQTRNIVALPCQEPGAPVL